MALLMLLLISAVHLSTLSTTFIYAQSFFFEPFKKCPDLLERERLGCLNSTIESDDNGNDSEPNTNSIVCPIFAHNFLVFIENNVTQPNICNASVILPKDEKYNESDCKILGFFTSNQTNVFKDIKETKKCLHLCITSQGHLKIKCGLAYHYPKMIHFLNNSLSNQTNNAMRNQKNVTNKHKTDFVNGDYLRTQTTVSLENIPSRAKYDNAGQSGLEVEDNSCKYFLFTKYL